MTSTQPTQPAHMPVQHSAAYLNRLLREEAGRREMLAARNYELELRLKRESRRRKVAEKRLERMGIKSTAAEWDEL